MCRSGRSVAFGSATVTVRTDEHSWDPFADIVGEPLEA
jgi:hypothetical protein